MGTLRQRCPAQGTGTAALRDSPGDILVPNSSPSPEKSRPLPGVAPQPLSTRRWAVMVGGGCRGEPPSPCWADPHLSPLQRAAHLGL